MPGAVPSLPANARNDTMTDEAEVRTMIETTGMHFIDPASD